MKSITQAIRDVRERHKQALQEVVAAEKRAESLAEVLETMAGLPELLNGSFQAKPKRKMKKARSVAKEVATPLSTRRPWLDVYRQLFAKEKERVIGEAVNAAHSKNGGTRDAALQGLYYLIRVGTVERTGDKVTWVGE